jgi:hypothetical protein
MKKKPTKTSNLFTPTGEAIPWEDATRETLLKRIMIAPLRFICGMPPKRVYRFFMAICVTIMAAWTVLVICGVIDKRTVTKSLMMSAPFFVAAIYLTRSSIFIQKSNKIRSFNKLVWAQYYELLIGKDENYFFSRFSPISILSGHKDSKPANLLHNYVDFDLSTYAELARGASKMEFMNDPRVRDAVCRILYAEMQIDRVTAYALEILGAAKNTDKPTTTQYQEIITQYKTMQNTAILELQDYVEQQNQETRRREYLRNAITASRA